MRRRDERVDVQADELLLVVTEQAAHRRVDRVDHARRVQRDEPIGHVVEHRAHALLALLQSNLGALALDVLSDLRADVVHHAQQPLVRLTRRPGGERDHADDAARSEEHTSELQSQSNLVCRLLLEKKKKYYYRFYLRKTRNKK